MDAVQAGEEQAALADRLGVRPDALDLAEGHVLGGEQAVLHLQDFLAHDVQAGLDEQVVDARDRPGRRVFDGQERAVRAAALERLDRAAERFAPVVLHAADGREVVTRRRVAVAARDALVGDAQPVALVVLLPDGLEADRVPQDLAIERGGEVAVDAGVLGELVHAREKRLLPRVVLDGERAVVGLDGGHLADERLPVGERVDQAAVDGVEVVAEGGEVRGPVSGGGHRGIGKGHNKKARRVGGLCERAGSV